MPEITTKTQISSGGVAYRIKDGQIEIALISVGDDNRWQLPKGLVNKGESPETTARREVREEAGIEVENIAPIDKIEYWYVSTEHGQRIRFHKFVYFYLQRYISGDPRHHDTEVNEARWVEIEQAKSMLTFASEQKIVERAQEMINLTHENT